MKLCSWAVTDMVTVPKKSGATESKMNNIKRGEEGEGAK